MITVQDILDIYERTGLKPSKGYRDYTGEGPNFEPIVRGCIVTAIYCDENKENSTNPTASTMIKYCDNKFGPKQSDGLEAGFCGWNYEEKHHDKEYHDIGAKAGRILFEKHGEENG